MRLMILRGLKPGSFTLVGVSHAAEVRPQCAPCPTVRSRWALGSTDLTSTPLLNGSLCTEVPACD
jgi:hypothetical protein